jgi:hypothetical protein
MSVLETTAAAPPVQQLHQNLKRKRTTASPTPPTPESLTRQNSETLSPAPRHKRSKSISNGSLSTKILGLESLKPSAWIEQTTLKALEEHQAGKDALYQNLKKRFDTRVPARVEEVGSGSDDALARYGPRVGRTAGCNVELQMVGER